MERASGESWWREVNARWRNLLVGFNVLLQLFQALLQLKLSIVGNLIAGQHQVKLVDNLLEVGHFRQGGR